jgi:hypothetical protein
LATYGVDASGQLFVHVKVYKQRRIFGEIIVTGGKVKLLCRECLRWYGVVIRQPGKAELQEFQVPAEVAGSNSHDPMLATNDPIA